MSKCTLTRLEICDVLSQEVGLSKEQSSKILDSLLNEIIQGLVRDGKVKISSFGTFHVHNKAQRMARNPKTGVEALVTARKSISFRSSKVLKEHINRGEADNI